MSNAVTRFYPDTDAILHHGISGIEGQNGREEGDKGKHSRTARIVGTNGETISNNNLTS